MADSKVTKKAMADALKQLSVDMPYAKISIGNICKQCNMSRKTFYYHFKDKEDLVNWIFETEFVSYAREHIYESVWDGVEDLLQYFYRNRVFYRKILAHEGQNSFSLYFNELIRSVFIQQLQSIIGNTAGRDVQINFIADGMVCMLKRWIAEAECLPPELLIREIEIGAKAMAAYIAQTLPQKDLSDCEQA